MSIGAKSVWLANIASGISAVLYFPPAFIILGMAHDSPNLSWFISLLLMIGFLLYPAGVYASIRFSRKYLKMQQQRKAVWVSVAPLLFAAAGFGFIIIR